MKETKQLTASEMAKKSVKVRQANLPPEFNGNLGKYLRSFPRKKRKSKKAI